jgi:predicted nuclease of predicted toxin-antitoxin system
MKLLPDANLSPTLANRLRPAAAELAHEMNLGLLTAPDTQIFDYAAAHNWVVVTADTDFSMLLALRSAGRPSVVLLRRVTELRPQAHADLLVTNRPLVAADLEHGAVVSLSATRLSVRRLPLSTSASDPQ